MVAALIETKVAFWSGLLDESELQVWNLPGPKRGGLGRDQTEPCEDLDPERTTNCFLKNLSREFLNLKVWMKLKLKYPSIKKLWCGFLQGYEDLKPVNYTGLSVLQVRVTGVQWAHAHVTMNFLSSTLVFHVCYSTFSSENWLFLL